LKLETFLAGRDLITVKFVENRATARQIILDAGEELYK